MRYIFLLFVMSILASCNFITNPGTSSDDDGTNYNAQTETQDLTTLSTVSIDYDAPAEPLDVTVILSDDETTSAVISPEGGNLVHTSADGSVYTLQVPAGALDVDTEISMTVIDTLSGGPVETKVYGVQLEPSGLEFNEILTLTIQPSVEILLEEQFMFKFEGNGTDFRRVLIDPNSREIRIFLTGFSGSGAGRVTIADLARWRMDRAQSAAGRIENAIGEQQALQRAGKITKQQAEQAIDRLLNELGEAVQDAEQAAAEDCKNLARAMELRQTLIRLDSFGSGLNLYPPSMYEKELEKCRTYRANGAWGLASLEGVITIGSPFSLNISNFCEGKMDFLGNRLSGPVRCDVACGGIRFKGEGYFNIKLTEDSGVIRGSCSSLAVGVPKDEAEVDPFYITLIRVSK